MTTYQPLEALPYLEAGGYFELALEPKKVGSQRMLLRMRLRASDGTDVGGCWGNAKKKLEKLGRLKTTITGTVGQRWYLK